MKKKKWKNLSFKSKNICLIIICFILLTLSSIAYSALNETIAITGDLVLRSVKDIRITSLELVETVNDGYEYYNSKYTTNTVSISASLPKKGSKVTYEVTIKNSGNVDMLISNLESSTSNELASITVTELEEKEEIEYGVTKTFQVTIENTTDEPINEVTGLVELTYGEVIPDSNYCLDNGIDTLSDCMLVMETNNPNVEESKTYIEQKGDPDFTKIAPLYVYKETEELNVTNVNTSITDNIYFSTTKPTLDTTTGKYTFTSNTATLGTIEQNLSDDTNKYYTCLNEDSTCNSDKQSLTKRNHLLKQQICFV